jgi:hypothetical protein
MNIKKITDTPVRRNADEILDDLSPGSPVGLPPWGRQTRNGQIGMFALLSGYTDTERSPRRTVAPSPSRVIAPRLSPSALPPYAFLSIDLTLRYRYIF